jgi:hypothetical protein
LLKIAVGGVGSVARSFGRLSRRALAALPATILSNLRVSGRFRTGDARARAPWLPFGRCARYGLAQSSMSVPNSE